MTLLLDVVAPIVEKMVETGLRWFGYVERRLVDVVVRRVDQMEDSQITIGKSKHRKTLEKLCGICHKF